MIRQNIFCSSTIEGHMYRRRAERKQASLIRLGMARIRARTAISQFPLYCSYMRVAFLRRVRPHFAHS
jgi:hypothetical protein